METVRTSDSQGLGLGRDTQAERSEDVQDTGNTLYESVMMMDTCQSMFVQAHRTHKTPRELRTPGDYHASVLVHQL